MRTLYAKVIKRLKKTGRHIIPFNVRYRPQGVCQLHTDILNEEEVVLHHIYPNCETALDISEDLYAACSSYWKPLKKVSTNYLVTEVPNGRIYTDNESSVAIISRFNRVVDNVSLSLKDGKVTEAGLNNIFQQRYFTEPVKVNGTVFSMLTGGAGLNNISHWFIDVLPRLHLLKESGLYDKVDWFLVPSLKYSYQTETLRLLGIPEEKLIVGEVYTHLTADCVIASTAPRGNFTLVPNWLCTYIRESFLSFAGDEETTMDQDTKIYISRSDSKIRNVDNEAELVSALQPYGFRSVVLSQLSIIDRIRLFSRATTIVSATGAGLVSMLFCRPGTKVIELFNEGFVIEPFYDIATKINLDYNYLICKGNKHVTNAKQGQHENLRVDIAGVVKLVQKKEEQAASTTQKAPKPLTQQKTPLL